MWEAFDSLRIPTADESVWGWVANWGVFGNKGGGKSTLAASAFADPEMRGIVVSTGTENIKPYRGVDERRCRVYKINRWDDLLTILLLLRKLFCLPNGEPNPARLESAKKFIIVFDTWTRMQGLAMAKLTGFDTSLLSDAQLGTLLTKSQPPLRGYDGWNALGQLSNQWMGYVQRIPCHKLFLFQMGTRDPKIPGEPYLTGPALTPVAREYAWESTELMGLIYADTQSGVMAPPVGDKDELVAAQRLIVPTTTEKRYLLIGQHKAYTTKGPTHLLGYALANPSFQKMAAILDPQAPVFHITEGKEETTQIPLPPISEEILAAPAPQLVDSLPL